MRQDCSVQQTRMDENKNKMRRRLTEPEQESDKEIMRRKMFRSAMILERMLNQNNHNDISQDLEITWTVNLV